jgi:predicted YcjX-like family ATPase
VAVKCNARKFIVDASLKNPKERLIHAVIEKVEDKGNFMDVTGIASVATTLADVGTSQAISIAVLKKANDINAESATSLIEAIPENKSIQNLPPNLGRNINTTA